MIDRIRAYLEAAFESAPKTDKVQELKEGAVCQSGGQIQ